MNEFLFTTQKENPYNLSVTLKQFRPDLNSAQQEWSGTWGSLVVVGPAYPGFNPVETSEYIIVVLGGPLPRYNNDVAAGTMPDDGTRWILEHWKDKKDIVWDDDLVGHFLIVCVEKNTGKLMIVTDINSFIPAYVSNTFNDVKLTIGSHADAVAVAAGVEKDVDPVSAADFLMHQTVTYPYTMYKYVKQLPPASEVVIDADRRLDSSKYWMASKKEPQYSFKEASKVIRKTFLANTERICSAQDKVGLLMSGGEDSRVVLAAIPEKTKVDGVTFVDNYNREARLAERIAKRFDIRWQCIERSRTHYIDHAISSVKLSESHMPFIHAHLNGLSNTLPGGKRCIGAYLGDALLKALHVSAQNKLGFTFKVNKNIRKNNSYCDPSILGDLANKKIIMERINERLEKLKKEYPSSWAELYYITASTMLPAFAHCNVKRRLCYSYEPFVDAKIFKIAMSIPSEWKINRKLFHTIMKPLLRKTWNIQHTKGFYPYFGFWINIPIIIIKSIYRKLTNYAMRFGVIKNKRIDEGSWPNLNNLITMKEFKNMLNHTRPYMEEFINCYNLSELNWLKASFANANFNHKIAHLHILLWLRNLKIINLDLQKKYYNDK